MQGETDGKKRKKEINKGGGVLFTETAEKKKNLHQAN